MRQEKILASLALDQPDRLSSSEILRVIGDYAQKKISPLGVIVEHYTSFKQARI